MRAVQHVFRRGAIYWWRRRLFHKDGESVRAPIAFSLRTRDLSKARSVAAHLAAASDGILRQEGANAVGSTGAMDTGLRAASDRTPLGDVFYGDWITVQNIAVPNADNERKAFHSFRKVGGADLKDAEISSEMRADILGHGGKNVTEERYVSPAKLRQMLRALELLPIVTRDVKAGEIRLRPDVLQKRKRPSARPRRQIRET